MKLVFISDKVCWSEKTSLSGYSTGGGFPFQMETISRLFDETRIVIMERKQQTPPNLVPLVGYNLSVHPLREPSGKNWRYLLSLLAWLPSSVRKYWQEIKQTDVLHIAVPGLGSIAILLALLQRKRMFIRHCGTWDQPATLANHVLLWLLEMIGSKQNIVFATGGAKCSPSERNPNIQWIYSTTLTAAELEQIPPARVWSTGELLRLITVCRLSESKNVQAIIQALPLIQHQLPGIHLDILGDGEYRAVLETLAADIGVSGAVTFHGNLGHEDVLKTLSRSHLFVFPTRVKEGFPKALLEAMACGLPVVATRVSVIPQLLANGCGMLLEDTTAPAVARAVLAITSDPGRMAYQGTLARQAAQGYTLEAWGETIGERLQAAWGPLKSEAK